jgi:tetratricopeptide (TPR) repeat protein
MKFKPDPLKAIKYFNKAIELNPVFVNAFYERGLIKKSLNIESACDDIIKAVSFENFIYTISAKRFVKENCN